MPYFHTQITPENLKSHPKNPSLCKFMIQLGRFEQLGSGVIKIHKYLPHYSGGAKPIFRDDPNGFELTLPLGTGGRDQRTGPSRGSQQGKTPPQVTPQVDHLLKVLQGEMSRVQIMEKLELKDREHFREYYLQRAIQAGLVEPTIPDKPNSSLQKYRLTPKGKALLPPAP